MTKENRHIIIEKIIQENAITSQNMLLDLLLGAGFELTQATLSRDIKELKIVKAPTASGVYTYQMSDGISISQDDFSSLASFKFLSFEFSGNLAVAKTRPGYAMAIAGEIDKALVQEVLGTVAGDDTILLILKEKVARDEVLEALSNYIPESLHSILK